MTTHIYQSAFATESTISSTSNAANLQTPLTRSSLSQKPHRPPEGSLASLICRVAYLENELRANNTAFFDSDHGIKAISRVQLGFGVSFSVERGTLASGPDFLKNSRDADSPKYIAIKRVKESSGALYVLYRAFICLVFSDAKQNKSQFDPAAKPDSAFQRSELGGYTPRNSCSLA